MSAKSLGETAVPSRAVYLKFTVLLSLTILCVLSLYTFLHEAGHTLAGLAFGQTLTAFSTIFWDLSAHVQLVGELTKTQQAVQSAAGAALPLLVWALFMSLAPRKATFTLELFKLVASMGVVNTLLVWIAIPLLDLWGKAPVNDDVTHFLRASELSPLWVTAVAATLYALGLGLFVVKSKGLAQFRQLETLGKTGTAVALMLTIMVILLLSTLTINTLATQNGVTRLSPPADMNLAAEVDLAVQAHENSVLTTLTVTESGTLALFFTVQDINTAYFDLRLEGPDDYSAALLHGEEYRANQDGGLQTFTVPPGAYQVVLTAVQSPGVLSIWHPADGE